MRGNLLSWPSECFASRSVSDWLHLLPAQSGILGSQVALVLELEGGQLRKRIWVHWCQEQELVPCPLSWGQREPQKGFKYGNDKVQSVWYRSRWLKPMDLLCLWCRV